MLFLYKEDGRITEIYATRHTSTYRVVLDLVWHRVKTGFHSDSFQMAGNKEKKIEKKTRDLYNRIYGSTVRKLEFQ